MPNPFTLIPNALPQAQTQMLYGYVSANQPLPTTFADPLYVVIPDWSNDYYWPITGWPASHGITMPAANAACMLIKDNRNNLRCVWWDGSYTTSVGVATASNPGSGLTIGTTSTQVLAANPNRHYAAIFNLDPAALVFVGLGATAFVNEGSVINPNNDCWETPRTFALTPAVFQGPVYCIANLSSVNISVVEY